MQILILEDSLERIKIFEKELAGHTLFIAKTPIEAEGILSLHLSNVDMIFLDHDLGNDATGMVIAKYLSNVEYKGIIIIHSMNAVGADGMYDIMKDSVSHVARLPFPLLGNTVFKSIKLN